MCVLPAIGAPTGKYGTHNAIGANCLGRLRRISRTSRSAIYKKFGYTKGISLEAFCRLGSSLGSEGVFIPGPRCLGPYLDAYSRMLG